MQSLSEYDIIKFLQSGAGSIRASKGFDGGLAAGEAIRCDTLIAKLKINAEDNLAYAA